MDKNTRNTTNNLQLLLEVSLKNAGNKRTFLKKCKYVNLPVATLKHPINISLTINQHHEKQSSLDSK
jgi:hypothetical protein